MVIRPLAPPLYIHAAVPGWWDRHGTALMAARAKWGPIAPLPSRERLWWYLRWAHLLVALTARLPPHDPIGVRALLAQATESYDRAEAEARALENAGVDALSLCSGLPFDPGWAWRNLAAHAEELAQAEALSEALAAVLIGLAGGLHTVLAEKPPALDPFDIERPVGIVLASRYVDPDTPETVVAAVNGARRGLEAVAAFHESLSMRATGASSACEFAREGY